jgi:hypothetical protein
MEIKPKLSGIGFHPVDVRKKSYLNNSGNIFSPFPPLKIDFSLWGLHRDILVIN